MNYGELLIIGLNILLFAYSVFNAVKVPTTRIMNLGMAFLSFSISILIIFSKFLLNIEWFFDNSIYIFVGMLIIYFNLLFIGSIITDKKMNEEKLNFANSLYTKKELRVKKFKRFSYILLLIIFWLVGIYYFGGNILINNLLN